MKTNSVTKKLGNFKSVTDKNGALCFYSRVEGRTQDRIVKVVDQEEGSCIALPIFINKETGEEQVVFHATTIKSLVEFLENKGV